MPSNFLYGTILEYGRRTAPDGYDGFSIAVLQDGTLVDFHCHDDAWGKLALLAVGMWRTGL